MKIGKPKHQPKPRPVIEGVTPIRQTGDPTPKGAGCGRPTAYRPEYCDALRAYFKSPESWRVNETNAGAAQVLSSDKIPTIQRFGVNLGVSDSTLYNWAKKHPDFAEAMAFASSAQKAFLMELGAAGVASPFIMFMLRCSHGMVEPKAETPIDNLSQQLEALIEKMPS